MLLNMMVFFKVSLFLILSEKTREDAEMNGFKVVYADTDGFFVTLKK